MSILVIGEKPSVSRELAKVLGAKNKKNGYIIAIYPLFLYFLFRGLLFA